MAKQGLDINLFAAASKADKKIQTGVSKSFMYVVIGIILLIAVVGYIGMILLNIQTLALSVTEYQTYQGYSSTMNAMTQKINTDKATLAAIQEDIDAAYAIKYYSNDTSILYPGLTLAQQKIVMTNTYLDESETEHDGCVPEGVVIDTIQFSYTDGLQTYSIYNQGADSTQEIVIPKGYVFIRFECTASTISETYKNNIVSLASDIFAVEADEESLEDSIEAGMVSMPVGQGNYVCYVTCKLKSIFQMILEDDYLSFNVAGYESIDFSGIALTLDFTTKVVPIYGIAAYLDSWGIFYAIQYSGENATYVTNHYEYTGTLVLALAEVEEE